MGQGEWQRGLRVISIPLSSSLRKIRPCNLFNLNEEGYEEALISLRRLLVKQGGEDFLKILIPDEKPPISFKELLEKIVGQLQQEIKRENEWEEKLVALARKYPAKSAAKIKKGLTA
jgi:hypothetical protein